jgi:hypothetical protein
MLGDLDLGYVIGSFGFLAGDPPLAFIFRLTVYSVSVSVRVQQMEYILRTQPWRHLRCEVNYVGPFKILWLSTEYMSR